MATVVKDPYFQSQVQNPTHSIQLRVINHGVSGAKKVMERQLHTTENLLSLCEGLQIKLKIQWQHHRKTRLQENLVSYSHPRPTLTDSFYKFFNPWSYERPRKTIDVHLVDFLSAQNRERIKQKKMGGQYFFGKAFLKKDIHFHYQNSENAHEIAGDSVLLALSLIKVDEKRNRMWEKSEGTLYFRNRRSTLLAHELGHLLLDPQTPQPGDSFIDHYCPGIDDHCPGDNLMSSGGYQDRIFFRSSKRKKVIGYDLYPKITTEQCQVLKQSSYLIPIEN